jgi:hypothetical protein
MASRQRSRTSGGIPGIRRSAEPVIAPVRLGYMQLVRLVPTGRRPVPAARRTRLTAITAGLLLLLASAVVLPPSAATTSHARGAISQLHRLAVEVDSASASGKDAHQTATDQAILAALVLLAAALAVLIGTRRRGQQPADSVILARRCRGPPADR